MRLTKLARRRKTILGAVLGFGAIALLTTGAASYIISVSNPSTENDVKISVDTVQGNFVELKIESASSTMKVTETSEINAESYAVGCTSEDGSVGPDENALSLNLGKVTITYGSEFLADNKNLGIRFSFVYPDGEDDSDGSNNWNRVQSALVLNVHNDSLKSDGYWTYLEAPDAYTEITESAAMENGAHTVTIDSLNVKFKWGTFFQNENGGNLSAAEFYNSHFYKEGGSEPGKGLDGQDIGTRSELTVATASQIAAELQQMKDSLEHGLTLTAEVYSY